MRQGKVGNLGELDSGSGAGMTVLQGSLSSRTTREVRGHRMEEKMGPRIREDKKWGRFFTPIPSTSSGQALAFPHP